MYLERNNSMRVLLIKPEFKNVFMSLSLIITEPLELEYLSAICKNKGTEVEICDLTIREKSLKYMLKKFKPDIVAITANFVHIHSLRKYLRIIKKYEPKILTVAGGPHAEVLPEDFQLERLDIIIHSGGFKAFENILDGEKKFENIKGICYKENGKWQKMKGKFLMLTLYPFLTEATSIKT